MELPCDNLILFDGACNLCAGSVQFILRRDKHGLFKFAPIQSEVGRRVYAGVGLDPGDLQTFVLATRAGVYLRSDAALETLRLLGGWWRLPALARLVPRMIRDWVYSFIARHRYRWFGRRASCLLPTDDNRARFLT